MKQALAKQILKMATVMAPRVKVDDDDDDAVPTQRSWGFLKSLLSSVNSSGA